MKTVSFDESEWQLVPVEATEEMLEAGFHAIEIGGGVTEQAWAALLAAAPTPAEPPTDLPTWENGDDPLVSGGLIHRGVVDLAMNQLLETLK